MTPTVPIEKFGKDHWSTFAYAETRVVDFGGGNLDPRHMRGGAYGDASQYPTRIKGEFDPEAGRWGFEHVEGHDDYDCLADLQGAGLLTFARTSFARGRHSTVLTHYVELTAKGKIVAGKLRAHKGSGGNFHDFDPGPTLGWWAAPMGLVST